MRLSLLKTALAFPGLLFAFAAAAIAGDSLGEIRYLRIDVAGYNIRTSPDFDYRRTANVAFRARKGSIYAVRRIVRMENGLAVNVRVDGRDRWVYVPNWRRHDFRLCESELCYSSLDRMIKALQRQNVTREQMAECGLALSPEGTVVRHEFPRDLRDIRLPDPRPARDTAADESRLSPGARSLSAGPLSVPPLWESARSDGKSWTGMLMESLMRHGQGLLRIRSLSDQKSWCPNYSRLSESQRREFWVHLLNGVARYESNFKTNVTFNEANYRNVNRGRVNPHTYSQGLFQISYGSAGQKAYRNFCRFDWGRDKYRDVSDSSLTIYNPKLQMDCAVGIMNYWVSRDKGLGLSSNRGGARFWSTLRSSNPATKRVRDSLRRFRPCW